MLLLTKYTVLYKENEICCIILLSLPSRERGLKYQQGFQKRCYNASLPSRERGLKCFFGVCSTEQFEVAPFAGAWIEIHIAGKVLSRVSCRSLRGSVD